MSLSVNERNGSEARHSPRLAWYAFASALAYVTIRYHLFKDVPWNDWPMFTVNKALALASLFLLSLTAIRTSLKARSGGTLYMAGLFGGTHVLLSVMILNPVYFDKLFLAGRLTPAASLALLAGAVGVVSLALGALRPAATMEEKGRSLTFLSLVIGIHAGLQGFSSWNKFSDWPGFMPPVTLISFFLGTLPLIIRMMIAGGVDAKQSTGHPYDLHIINFLTRLLLKDGKKQ